MGLYNIVFQMNPVAPLIMRTLGFNKPGDVGRFRDAFVANGEIAIYTRNGGDNRHCIYNKTNDCGEVDCYGCIITHRLPKHPLYLRDQDDNFDKTYATIYFRIPEEHKQQLAEYDTGRFDPDTRWKNELERMKTGQLSDDERKLGERFISAINKLKI